MRTRSAVLLGLVVLAACGGGDSPSSPSASPSPAAQRQLTLAAHLDLAALVQTTLSDDGLPLRAATALAPRVVSGAGIWGYTSPDGRRFALTGTSDGLSIVEVTDPARPRNVGLVPGAPSPWREVRTFRHYAYVSTEARWGMDIIDLSDPDRPRRVRTLRTTFQSAHTVTIDEARGFLFANGTDRPGGGMRVLDLNADPENPPEIARFTNFYVHDATVRGNLLYAAAISDGFLALLDITDPTRIREISRFTTGGQATHNAWPTADGRFLFTTDERLDRPLEGWDLADPTAPRKVSEYIGARGSIPHNVMIVGARMAVSHYTEGVHLLDVSNPASPQVVGVYDTYPGGLTGFHGCWGAYLFPSGDLIVASDIEGGLFVVRP